MSSECIRFSYGALNSNIQIVALETSFSVLSEKHREKCDAKEMAKRSSASGVLARLIFARISSKYMPTVRKMRRRLIKWRNALFAWRVAFLYRSTKYGMLCCNKRSPHNCCILSSSLCAWIYATFLYCLATATEHFSQSLIRPIFCEKVDYTQMRLRLSSNVFLFANNR